MLFEGAKEKRLVSFDRTAESEAVLNARERRFFARVVVDDRSERIPRLYRAMANETENVSIEIICSAFGDNVYNAARGAAELGQVGVRRDLIFLNGFLRNGRASGVDRVVGKISSVYLDQCRASALAADVQARCGCGTDRRTVVAADGRDRKTRNPSRCVR